jgi:hypothetical protein
MNFEKWTPAATGFDDWSNYSGDDFSDCYVAPCTITRDTEDSVSLANWQAQIAELEPLAKHEASGVHRFGHWGPGWFELFLIHESDTDCLAAAGDIEASLADYPVLDDDLHSELEREAQAEAWESWGRSELKGELERALKQYAPDDASPYWAGEAIDAVPESELDGFFSEVQWCEDSSGPVAYGLKDLASGMRTLIQLTGLALLPVGQEWRREPYPWPDGSTEPLALALPSDDDAVALAVQLYHA